ncbi:MAG: 4'-phosphopantetheinyl transferase superfamily protein [Geobacter sp.]|jgi:4'-phosphopantetheinyl transferase|nr:4'-phosphopantetheinyl transferase superfamily protein [Geobacter sp.]
MTWCLQPEQISFGSGAPELFLLQLPSLTDDRLAAQLAAACSADRLAWAARYRLPDDRLRSLAAGWLLGYALHAVVGRSFEELKEPGGRSYLSDRSDLSGLQFSIAHSGCWVACALHSGAVGVDLELLQEPGEGVTELVMAPSELAVWQALPDTAIRQRWFCCLWTLKEAWLKMLGTGLDRSPADCTVETLYGPSADSLRGVSSLLPDGSGMVSLCWRLS